MLAQFRSTIAAPWLSMNPVRIGSVSPILGTPGTYVTVMNEDDPVLRIDVYGNNDEAFCCSESVVWNDWVIIGFGHQLHFVNLSSQKTLMFNLKNYFRQLYFANDLLFAASASQLFCFNSEASRIWSSNDLGVYGVTICQVDVALIK